jgi:hypothetical protein
MLGFSVVASHCFIEFALTKGGNCLNRMHLMLCETTDCKKLMNEKQRMAVTENILSGSRSNPINTAQGSIDKPALVQLVRAGIFSSTGTLSCLVAQWLYFNSFYNRPTEGPKSIEELIFKAVQSMSALRLRQSCDSGNFPKEAAFQQLLMRLLQRNCLLLWLFVLS